MFICVAYTFALVGFRLLEKSDCCGGLTHKLFVNTGDINLCVVVRNGKLYACGHIVNDRMRISEIESQLLPCKQRLVTEQSRLDAMRSLMASHRKNTGD